MFLLVLLVTLGNFALGFGLAMLLGYGPKWRPAAPLRPIKRQPAA